MLALVEIQDFLQQAGRGEIDSSRFESLIKQFGKDCEDSLRKQLSRRDGYRIRMSGLGRPLCQQKMEKKGHKQDVAYNDVVRFLIGDLVEAVAIFTMKAAGVNVVDTQRSCELNLSGEKIKGTLDLIMDDGEEKVWDVKSASPWAFDNKFGGRVVMSCRDTCMPSLRTSRSVVGLQLTSPQVSGHLSRHPKTKKKNEKPV